MVRFSILIPAYNAGKYILENLNSLKFQTFKDWEAIIINDGSTDNTLAIINKFIQENHNLKIKLISIPNGGLANARNVALQNAAGEYFCNLDADDFLERDTLEIVNQYIHSETSNDIYYFDIIDFDEVTKTKTNISTKYGYSNPSDSISGINAAIMRLERRIWICQGVAFYKKSFIDKINLSNIIGVNQGEDLYFITAALCFTNKVKYVPGAATVIRHRGDSMMHALFSENLLQCLDALDNLKNKLLEIHTDLINIEIINQLIEKEYILQELRIYKSICDSWGLSNSFSQTRQLLNKYAYILSPLTKEVRQRLLKSHIIQYFLSKYFPSLFILSTKLYRFVK